MNRIKPIFRKLVPESAREWARRNLNIKIFFTRFDGKVNYREDGLVAFTNADFLQNPQFIESYKLGKATGSWGSSDIRWRVYVACWAASQARLLPGDFVECGVNRGGLSRAIIHYIKFEQILSKKFFLLDTYNGLVEDYITAEERTLGIKPGGFSECYEIVKETFRPFSNVEIIRGVVPETLPLVQSERICYLSLDMNCAPPEIAAANYFWDKMVPGGIILLDDYGGMYHTVQKHKMDEFAQGKGVAVLSLPTGQGILIKP